MKFYHGFLGVLALGSGMVYAAMHIVTNFILNGAMMFGGAALLAIDFFALAVWLVNWKYYSSD